MNNLKKVIDEIMSLKIQGATNVAKTALNALLSVPEEDFLEAIEKLLLTRPTEPLMQNSLNLVRQKGKAVIRLLLAKLDDIKGEIVNNGLPLIQEASTILIHCHSSTVVKLLQQAKKQSLNFKVYLTETRPLFQGRITARELVGAGISATMITDSEAAFLISRQDKKDIDLVFLGADAITADGGVVNKVGSYGLALSAHEAKIPLYVVAKLLKFSSRPVVFEERGTEEIWPDKPAGLEIFNPAFDFIPPVLITGFVCEFGIIKPEKIRTVVKKNYPWILQKTENRKPKTETPYKSYLHLNEKVDLKTHIMAEYLLRVGKNSDFEEVAGGVAAESSVGTWTKVETESQAIFDRLHAQVLEKEEKTGFLKIAYPLDLFEAGNIPQLLSSVAGNIFGLKEIISLKLLDLLLPEKYVRSFAGPALGIDGIRKLSGVFGRPLIGCIIKPKLGLDYKIHARVARDVFEGGVDFVKDDENLTSQFFNPFEKRVKEICFNVLKQGNKKIYAFNVTAPTETMIERAKMIKDKGGNCLMIDFLTAGFAGLQSLRAQNLGLIIHGHRAMHAVFDRLPNQGITMLVLAKLARLAGVDSLHTGTVVGKMEGGEKEVIAINKFLLGDWYGLRPVLPVASGGLHPALLSRLFKIFGQDVLLNFGGGIHGHPQGSKAGAAAVKEGIEAVKKEISLWEYAKTHENLAIALEHWNVERSEGEQ